MSTTRRLQHPSELEAARRALELVFANPDTAVPGFGPHAVARGVLQPVDRDLDLAIRKAVATAADRSPLSAHITTIGRWDEVPFDARPHWLVRDLCEPDLYDQLDAHGWNHLEESAVYDPEGTWGLLVAFDWYAIVAGGDEFVSRLRATLPPGVEWGIAALRQAQGAPRTGYDFSWIDRLEAALAR
jgi:hypothetical protein